ncbi:50S ribosomal protein L28 [Streptacidiphilus sp. PB12-B1b]|uniref:50S ribosomal protein L28 n=1 Tax=Streptacidiphilus sp. PB12-B1b TaxID=2705012 RepID=UPI0015F852F0|nr:50S ribosomal protein L28 [Streptacidiphilus sp. PB12-B1b]QMU79384.1 50S ribosomal protein L28 [Streptacidiphilus sp. PB12-B1b]
MANRCDSCEKEPTFGRTVARLGRGAQNRRIKGRSARRFNPNIQTFRTVIDGTPKRLKLCTSCLKKGKFARRVAA